MSKVIFTFEGIDSIIQCTKKELMKDICQKFANKIKEQNMNSLIFLYGGNLLNFNISFEQQTNMIDKERNQMNVLVYKIDINEYVNLKYGDNIKINKEKINEIKLSINNLKDSINGIKLNINNIIKTSKDNSVNIQLKNINLILSALNDDIKNITENLCNLLSNKNIDNKLNNELICDDKHNTNYIEAEIVIKNAYINKNIRILNSYEEFLRTNPNEIQKSLDYYNENEIKKCQIKINEELISFNYYHKFKTIGKYKIKYLFKSNINNTSFMFGNCQLLTKIDLSNFNSKNIIYTNGMFYGCKCLNNINLSNFNTNDVINMSYMFLGCSSLTNIDFSNFNTNNVTNMSYMFSNCSSLNNINLSNFNTDNVIYMSFMFHECSSLTKLNLSNFNNGKVIDMSCMFYGCSSLANIDLSNFDFSNDDGMMSIFGECTILNKKNIVTKKKKTLNNSKLFQEL